MTTETGSWTYALRLGLGPVPASRDEVLAELGSRLDGYEPRLSETPTGLEILLTVAAGDLWLAVLMTMTAMADVGYPVQRLEAHPVASPTGRRPRAVPES